MVLLNSPIPVAIESNHSRQWDMSPAFLNMENVDLEVAPAVVATSPYIDLRNFFNYKMFIDVTEASSASGVFKITLEEFAPGQVTDPNDEPTPIDTEDILTLIDGAVNGQKEILLWGATVDSALFSSGSGTAATKSLNLGKHKMLWIARFKLEVTTEGTGGTSTVSVRLQAGD